MAITMNWATTHFEIPRADMTFVSGTIYDLDTDALRLELKALEASEEGIVFVDIHRHNTEVTVAGVTYARTIEIINGYTYESEDLGHPGYSVRLAGSNNNLFEDSVVVTNHNSIIAQNSAGLQIVTQGSGITAQDKTDIISGVWLAKEEVEANVTKVNDIAVTGSGTEPDPWGP